MTDLPANVYRVKQRDFNAIPRSPWVYWLSPQIRDLFERNVGFENVADVGQGMTTADNTRFLRYWWELPFSSIGFGYETADSAEASEVRWFPYMKGGGDRKWYGHLDLVINWWSGGLEVETTGRATIRNSHRYFEPGITWSSLSSTGFSARLMPTGFLFDDKGSSCGIGSQLRDYGLALLNSSFASYALGLLNPSISVQSGDIKRLPALQTFSEISMSFGLLVPCAIRNALEKSSSDEATFDFIAPPRWDTGLDDLAAAQVRLTALESQIDDEVYRLYSISDKGRAAIEAELAGGSSADEGTKDETKPEPPMTAEELAVRWISYAVGIVLGRFQPGLPPRVEGDGRGGLGSAVYHRDDFAVGSLPEPDEAEFDQLVGPADRFAYVDADGGRHVFPAQVEAALRDLALPDGIAVLDEGHERDLPALVERALMLMLDVKRETSNVKRQAPDVIDVSRLTFDAPNTAEVIRTGAAGDLRKFLERDFFTKWHLKWYRKRPVYWPLQSARRSYGFVIFHERVGRSTLYVLQRDYLDHKLNGLRLQIGDLQGQLEGLSGVARKRVERQIDQATQLLDELTEFAQTMERVVSEGYEPAPDWIDDGVILRMAPLWELIPIWKREPKKYWERLQRGDYDWSHIAKRYWPERVREACKANKSFAIAHGHEEWCEGE